MLKGFKQFILRGNVVDLAVAVLIGSAFGTVISSLVKDILTPLIAAIGGQPDFSSLYFTVNNSRFTYGNFINALISFLLVSAIIYFLVVVPMSHLASKTRTAEVPSTRKCPECLSDVPLQARKCAFCTSSISPVAPIRIGR